MNASRGILSWTEAGVMACMLFLFSGHAACARASSPLRVTHNPASVIQDFDQALVHAMQIGKPGGFAARYEILSPVIQHSFASGRIAQLLVGPAWPHFSPSQQKRLGTLFEHYTIANYASEFRRYHGETFRVMGTRHDAGYEVVSARLLEPDGHSHTFTYLMAPDRGHWKIINIFVDGVSNVALLRSQYLYIIRKSGPVGLLRYIQKATQKLEKRKL